MPQLILSLLQLIFDVMGVHVLTFGVELLSRAQLALKLSNDLFFLRDESLELSELKADLAVDLLLLFKHVSGRSCINEMLSGKN